MTAGAPRSLPEQILVALRSGTVDDLRQAMTPWNWCPDEIDAEGLSLIFHAIHQGRFNLAEWLIRAGADVDAAGGGWTPLFWAAFNGRAEAVAFLLANGADPDLPSAEGDRPLVLAAYKGHAMVVRMLLAADARPELADRSGHDALWVARARGHRELLSLLEAAAAPGCLPPGAHWPTTMQVVNTLSLS